MVFNLPNEFNPVIMGNRSKLFDLFFKEATKIFIKHVRMPEYLVAEPGITKILHTWKQELNIHSHVHSIVSAGDYNGHWWIKAKQKNNKFLFPEKSKTKMYKAIFMEVLEKDSSIIWNTDKNAVIKAFRFKKWNDYANPYFG